MTSKVSDDDPIVFTNYESTLYQSFGEIFKAKELSDATLVCEDITFNVHKFLLSATSPYFNNMFKESQKSEHTISGIHWSDLINILQYIYTGKIQLTREEAASFLDAANKLSVPINCDDLKEITLNNFAPMNLKPKKQNSDSSKTKFEEAVKGAKLGQNGAKINCDGLISGLRGLSITDAFQNDKHNLDEEASTSKIPGVVEVSREEFLKKMFSAKGLPWPGDRSVQQAPPKLEPKQHSVAQDSSRSSSSSNKPTVVEPKKVKNKKGKPNNTTKEKPKPSSSGQNSKIESELKEIKRLIKAREENIAGSRNRMKRFEDQGKGEQAIQKLRQEIALHKKCLSKLKEEQDIRLDLLKNN